MQVQNVVGCPHSSSCAECKVCLFSPVEVSARCSALEKPVKTTRVRDHPHTSTFQFNPNFRLDRSTQRTISPSSQTNLAESRDLSHAQNLSTHPPPATSAVRVGKIARQFSSPFESAERCGVAHFSTTAAKLIDLTVCRRRRRRRRRLFSAPTLLFDTSSSGDTYFRLPTTNWLVVAAIAASQRGGPPCEGCGVCEKNKIHKR